MGPLGRLLSFEERPGPPTMNTSSHTGAADDGASGPLAPVGAGALAGSVLGLVDGALAARNGAWEGALGLLGCLTGAMALYALLAGLTALVLGWVLDRVLSARDQATRLRLTLTVVLGLGLTNAALGDNQVARKLLEQGLALIEEEASSCLDPQIADLVQMAQTTLQTL